MRALFIALSLCIAAMAYAQSAEKGAKPKAKTNDPCQSPCCYQNCPPQLPVTINVSPTQTLNGGSAEPKKQEYKESEWEKWTGIGTVGLAFFTALLAWVGIRQRADLKDTSQKELRAYVALEHVCFVKDGSQLTNQLTIRVNNYGQTPSFATSIFCRSHTQKPAKFETGNHPGVGKQMLHPRMGYSIQINEDTSPHHDASGWVWGHIVYRDIFERWWRTNFFYCHHGKSHFTPESEYNEEKGPYATEAKAIEGA